ncbi:MAG: branched-chain amino acid transaminase [Ignavibacteria bacterium]|nr:branched-chain amino acid transaminase [Bacteroidota bacterium]MSQ45572.1 branched-chain amino acid transaminase [Ignavibacteria bacterium]
MAPVTPVSKIWMNGKLVDWKDANIHILSHVVHYGSSWFEGIRCYDTKKGRAVLRLDEHINRLYNSTKIYRTEIPFTKKEFTQGVLDTIKANGLPWCYIRPIVYRGYGGVGVISEDCPVDASIIVFQWGKYLGADSLEKGVDVCVSSWTRSAPNTMPTLAKVGANYMNSQLIKMEAYVNGYKEGIALTTQGYVSEGSGENLFLVSNGILYTPLLTDSVLPGITRASIFELANDVGLKVEEKIISREMLYIADELFFVGTATEVTPIRSVDRIQIGNGIAGPITRKLQQLFTDVIENGNDKHNWLTFV